ncbi:bifunctional 2-polyprenyl-6-hydroxyphenol methylase/3-demethylubiquinol 3-O-methyltransferase UbiG [Actinokineospora sp. UTMC 2448]|uniref:class I SAM-dependent methyltransferase n=1 Tax=Actinokineospora sp. UTMC 2448 TaxID=2268449 RepID=UPI0021644BAA|nr:class I SAM-dependent methyltransferase [Actinokineospora sp. UTMC 2448]UVS79061.1 Tellurite methyltransferase [Actinokineospora sp. UTMC 2448]
MFDQAYWEERYRAGGHHRQVPSPQLVAEVADLPPGTALEAGCGEGANAIWLAGRGWRVTAVDISATALERAREDGADVPVDWVHADLTDWTPPAEHFDLVSAHYVHPTGPPGALFAKLASAVSPGGTLLVVGHDPADHHSVPEAHSTTADVIAALEPDRWDVVVAESRTRVATDPHGRGVELHDAVLRARKRS